MESLFVKGSIEQKLVRLSDNIFQFLAYSQKFIHAKL